MLLTKRQPRTRIRPSWQCNEYKRYSGGLLAGSVLEKMFLYLQEGMAQTVIRYRRRRETEARVPLARSPAHALRAGRGVARGRGEGIGHGLQIESVIPIDRRAGKGREVGIAMAAIVSASASERGAIETTGAIEKEGVRDRATVLLDDEGLVALNRPCEGHKVPSFACLVHTYFFYLPSLLIN